LRRHAIRCDDHAIGSSQSEEAFVDKKAKTPKKPKQNKPKGAKTSKTQ
jgi:hypothetical protein